MPDGMSKAEIAKVKLLGVDPEIVEEKKPTGLIYGAPGVGKTWMTLDWPSCYFFDTEGGANLRHYRIKLRESGGRYLGPAEGSLDFDIIINQIKLLATVRHHFRTVVIDSISKLWAIALSDEQESLGAKDAFGAYKKAPTRKYHNLIKWLHRLDMNVLLIAHERELWGLDDKKQRAMIGYTYDGQDKLEHDLDFSIRVYKLGTSRYGQVNKSRLEGLREGEVFPWSYEEVIKRVGRDLVEKEAVPLDLATPEQLAELTHLMGVVRMHEDWEPKVLKAANVEAWPDMDTVKIQKCIDMLKDKIRPMETAQ